ncbi:hypothetical protein Gotur_025929 [Gossypium turneri]
MLMRRSWIFLIDLIKGPRLFLQSWLRHLDLLMHVGGPFSPRIIPR